MRLTPPTFWDTNSFLSKVLSPVSGLVTLATRWRQTFTQPYKVSIPVICVGNVTVGGSGKTPLVITLVLLLKRLGYKPHILSRGYGVKLKRPLLVDPQSHQATEVGDEPLLLAKVAPTWVFSDRRASAELAIKEGATILLMDDGFQNPKLYKDIHLLVVDGNQGFGNGKVLPAGPLREPLEEALKRATAIISYRDTSLPLQSGKPLFTVKMVSEQAPKPGRNYIAFAGIGQPQKFFDSLEENGFPLAQTIGYPDHFSYDKKTIGKLHTLAEKHQAILITTEKDAVKLPINYLENIEIFSIRTQFDLPDFFEVWLKSYLKN